MRTSIQEPGPSGGASSQEPAPGAESADRLFPWGDALAAASTVGGGGKLASGLRPEAEPVPPAGV